jgi:tetratricopeptide (TPR) repeat protein
MHEHVPTAVAALRSRAIRKPAGFQPYRPCTTVAAAALLALLALCGNLHAQDAAEYQPPADAYTQDDPAARFTVKVDPGNQRARETLEQILEYDGRNVMARVQHGHMLVDRGMRQRALAEFEYAIRVADADSVDLRVARWNFGWALLRTGDPRAAMAQWRLVESAHGGRPAWLPAQFAAALWIAGDREYAVDYYAAAVRSNPSRWGERGGMESVTSEWEPNERLAIEAVYGAWRERIGASS